MDEETRQEFEELKERIKVLETFMSLDAPLDFKNTVQTFSQEQWKKPANHNKGADSEDRSVDEGGAATYTVLKQPIGFIELKIDNQKYYLPYYNA